MSDGNGRTHEPDLREITAQLDWLEKLLDERDRRYEEKFSAIEKLSLTEFKARDEAIGKALAAQQHVNEQQNEFRGQLRDQAATFIPRAEVTLMAQTLRDLIGSAQSQIHELREEGKIIVGRETRATEARKQTQWVVGLFATVIGAALGGLIVALLTRVH